MKKCQKEHLPNNDSSDLEKNEKRNFYKYLHYLVPWRRHLRTIETQDSYSYDDNGFLQIMFYTWLLPLIWKGIKKTLTQEDLGCPSKDVAADTALRKFKQYLLMEKNRLKDPKQVWFPRVFFRFVFGKFCVALLMLCINIITEFVCGGILLRRFLEFLDSPDEPKKNGYIIVGIFGILLSVRQISKSHLFFTSTRIGVFGQVAVTSLIYDKTTKLKSIEDKSVGELVNLCANDSTRVFECSMFTANLIGLPFVVILNAIYLSLYFGPTALVGTGIILMFIPLQLGLAKVFTKLREKAVAFTDKRVKMISEVLVAIKLIKMYAWEKSFAKIIYDFRSKERHHIQLMAFVQGFAFSLGYIIVVLSPVAVFLTHYLCGYELNAPKVFTVMTLFNTMSLYIVTGPIAMRGLAEALVSFNRIKTLMEMEEHVSFKTKCMDENNHIEVTNANLSWKKAKNAIDKSNCEETEQETSQDKSFDVTFKTKSSDCDKLILGSKEKLTETLIPTLLNVNMIVQKNSLIGICGAVGSGKSSILQALLGEMVLTDGNIAITDSIAYVSQQAWIMNATVRENILFGKDYEENFFQEVCMMCSLDEDLKLMSSGDLTEVGERGINLSGGQKQRISLARALYAEKELYLLDDPLSAVDSHVGKHIFEKCIKLALREKTVVLVTHQLQYLKDCDYVYYMSNGQFVEQGIYNDLMKDNKDFAHDVKKFHAENENEHKPPVTHSSHDFLSVSKYLQQSSRSISCHSLHDELAGEALVDLMVDDDDGIEKDIEEQGKLIQVEEMDKGSVSLRTYLAFCQFAGGFIPTFFVFCFIFGTVGLTIFGEYWISKWVDAATHPTVFNLTSWNSTQVITESVNTDYFMRIYVIIAALLLGLTASSTFITVYVLLRASTTLHNEVFRKLLKAPMEFFDTTPIGRIVNRLAKDVDEIDCELPTIAENALRNLARVLGIIVFICLIIPWYSIAAVPLIILFLLLNHYFRKLIRTLKRLSNITRSPVYSHMTATVQGLVTIRAYQRNSYFIEKFHFYLNQHSLPFYLNYAVARCFGFFVDWLFVFLVILTCFLAIVLKETISTTLAGLCVTYGLRITGLFQFAFRLLADLESKFTAVERLNHYVTTLSSEGEFQTTDSNDLEKWPENGSIEFTNVSLQYRDGLPLVLKNLSFSIKSQEKIGIVGRTGAGKSSICSALYRLVNLEQGSIKIAGKSINDIGLTLLRSKLSIIPQDPTLFIGTIRYNLDPFEEHSDEEIWNALEKAHIKNMLSEMPEKLETMVMENGSNFSVGERQLICMARALLRKNKILIMDEATASIDSKTDCKIQETIKEAFSDSTVLTIAHRLNTIMHCDRIVVMEDGKIAEFDSPSILLQKDSIFKGMVLASNARIK